MAYDEGEVAGRVLNAATRRLNEVLTENGLEPERYEWRAPLETYKRALARIAKAIQDRKVAKGDVFPTENSDIENASPTAILQSGGSDLDDVSPNRVKDAIFEILSELVEDQDEPQDIYVRDLMRKAFAKLHADGALSGKIYAVERRFDRFFNYVRELDEIDELTIIGAGKRYNTARIRVWP